MPSVDFLKMLFEWKYTRIRSPALPPKFEQCPAGRTEGISTQRGAHRSDRETKSQQPSTSLTMTWVKKSHYAGRWYHSKKISSVHCFCVPKSWPHMKNLQVSEFLPKSSHLYSSSNRTSAWRGGRTKRAELGFAVTDIFGRECHVAQDSSALFFQGETVIAGASHSQNKLLETTQ